MSLSEIKQGVNPVELAVINAYGALYEVKNAAPGSDFHHRAMVELVELLAKDPQALESFCKLQTIRESRAFRVSTVLSTRNEIAMINSNK